MNSPKIKENPFFGSPCLAVSDLRKSFVSGETRVQALNIPGLILESGCMTVLTGPSGSGKTTFINVICGIEKPDSGRVAWGDRIIWPSRDASSSGPLPIGLMMQKDYFIEDLTLRENLLITGQLLGLFNGFADPWVSIIAPLAERLGLLGRQDRLPRELSGGEVQRFSLIRALMGEAPVIVADEPTAMLDRESSTLVLDLLQERARSGKLVLVATHDGAVMERAERRVRLSFGGLA